MVNKWDRRDSKRRKRKGFKTDNRKSVRNILNIWKDKLRGGKGKNAKVSND